MERKLPGKFLSKIWVYLERLSSFLEMSGNCHYRCGQPKNAVPFATGCCWKFKPEILVEWKASLVSICFKIIKDYHKISCMLNIYRSYRNTPSIAVNQKTNVLFYFQDDEYVCKCCLQAALPFLEETFDLLSYARKRVSWFDTLK